MGDESEIAICLTHFSLKAVNSSSLSASNMLRLSRKVFLSLLMMFYAKQRAFLKSGTSGVFLARQGFTRFTKHFHRMVSCGRKRKCKHSITENYECRCRTITYARLAGGTSHGKRLDKSRDAMKIDFA